MPLYEYRCENCGARFEKIEKFSDPPVAICEKCGGHVERLISPPAIQFKGTGWYVTDYGGKSSGNGRSSSNQSEDKGKKKTETTQTTSTTNTPS